MNWWEQMPWIVAAAAIVVGPFIASIAAGVTEDFRRRDDRTKLLHDLELFDKLPASEAKERFAQHLEERTEKYTKRRWREHITPAALTLPQRIVWLSMLAVSFGSMMLGYVVLVFNPKGALWEGGIARPLDIVSFFAITLMYSKLAAHFRKMAGQRNAVKSAEAENGADDDTSAEPRLPSNGRDGSAGESGESDSSDGSIDSASADPLPIM
ncbi:MAG: hypothetical protein WAW17_26255 [Rhodococcus sp. (in: high G+C Gram-positive bacteria)]|uniref:hypothetical protein n=1 Tax=Rhodococcus sp. TaxID=1831 RepID=UPI003BB2048E